MCVHLLWITEGTKDIYDTRGPEWDETRGGGWGGEDKLGKHSRAEPRTDSRGGDGDRAGSEDN